MLPKPVRQVVNGHPIHTRRSLIGTYPPVRANDIHRVAYLLHQIDCQGSLWVECRERLLLSLRRETGAARFADARMLIAVLLLYAHRNLPSAPCIKRFSPSPGKATMASADFSAPVPEHCCPGS